MPELTFVFGPNNTFFFDNPKSWKFLNIPPTLRQLFHASTNPGWRVQQPYCLAIGPQNGTPEPIWYIGCKVCDGSDKIFYSNQFFEQNYPDLAQWTKTIPNSPQACFVTFGPGFSYFGCAPGYGSIWAGIPGDLKEKVQKAYDTPCQVSLGANDSWFVMWPDGYYAWNFYGAYQELNNALNEAEPRSVSYLAISPFNKNQYFVAFRNRAVKYSLQAEWMPQMQEVFQEWQADLAQAHPQPPYHFTAYQQQHYYQEHPHPTSNAYPVDVKGPIMPQMASPQPVAVYPYYASTPQDAQFPSPQLQHFTPQQSYAQPMSITPQSSPVLLSPQQLPSHSSHGSISSTQPGLAPQKPKDKRKSLFSKTKRNSEVASIVPSTATKKEDTCIVM